MSGPQDVGELAVYRGDAWSQTFRFWSDGVGGTGLNLTTQFGTTFTAQLRYSPDTTTYVAVTVDASNAATGVLVLTLTGAQTTGLPATCFFDIQATGGTLSPRTFIVGRLKVAKDVTR